MFARMHVCRVDTYVQVLSGKGHRQAQQALHPKSCHVCLTLLTVHVLHFCNCSVVLHQILLTPLSVLEFNSVSVAILYMQN